MRINIVTEASTRVGSGHFHESVALAEALLSREGTAVELAVNEDAPQRLLARAPAPLQLVTLYDVDTCRNLAVAAASRGARRILVNLRRATDDQLDAFATGGLPVICIDETGRDLSCDALINPTWAGVTSKNKARVIYQGPDYLPLAGIYLTMRDESRPFTGPLGSILASFGGADSSDISLAVVRALAGWRPEVRKSMVLGPLFGSPHRLKAEIERAGDRSWGLHIAPPSLAPLLGAVDVGLSAGGNTLFELACVGTPAVVIYEDPHEGDAGQAFESHGFGRCLCQAAELSSDALRGALAAFDDPQLRQRQAVVGKRLVDGRGTERIADLIVRMGGSRDAT